MAKKSLPHDTPVDTPAVGAMIEAVDLGPDAEVLGAQALTLALGVETLEAAWEAWAELKLAHQRARKRWVEERKRLEEQGSLLLGAVRAASGASPGQSEALTTQGSLDAFLVDARQKLEATQRSLDEKSRVADEAFGLELAKLRDALLARVKRQAATMRPTFKLAVRVLGPEQRILHAHRLGHDESVIALFALTGRIPSRYGYLFDDSTEDVGSAPPALYADEGVTEVRPGPARFIALLEGLAEVWPVKGGLPVRLPDGSWMRWVARGPVLEAEVRDGEGFRNVLTREEAERLTGLLLANKLAGKLELELVRE